MSQRPSPLPRFYRWRSNVLQAPVLGLVTAMLGTTVLLVSLVDKKGRVQHLIARMWARGCLWACWSGVKVCGAENLRKHGVAVYASNHTSYMDTPIIFAGLPFQFRILAKKSLWEWPFIGWFLRRSGQMPIDTAGPRRKRHEGGAWSTMVERKGCRGSVARCAGGDPSSKARRDPRGCSRLGGLRGAARARPRVAQRRPRTLAFFEGDD